MGRMAFVGFGVSAPEFDYDDFAAVDVRGKIVVEFWGAPSKFPTAPRAYYSDGYVKTKMAAAHGAIGLIGDLGRPVGRADSLRAAGAIFSGTGNCAGWTRMACPMNPCRKFAASAAAERELRAQRFSKARGKR